MDLGWRRCLPAPGQRPYYFNIIFQTTQWDLPAGLTEANVADFTEADEAAVNEADLVPVEDLVPAPATAAVVLAPEPALAPTSSDHSLLSSNVGPAPTAPTTEVEPDLEPISAIAAADAMPAPLPELPPASSPESLLAEFAGFPSSFLPTLPHPPLPAVCSRGIGDDACPPDYAWEARHMPSSGHETGELYFLNPRTGAQAWEPPPVVLAVAGAMRSVRRSSRRAPPQAALLDICALDAQGGLTDPLLRHAAVLHAHNSLAALAAGAHQPIESESTVTTSGVLPFLCRHIRPSVVHPATARLASRALRLCALIAPAAFVSYVGGAGGEMSPSELIMSCCSGAAAAFLRRRTDNALLEDWMGLLLVTSVRLAECCGHVSGVEDESITASAARIRESLDEEAFPWTAVSRVVLARCHAGGPTSLAIGVSALASLHRLFEVCHVGSSDDIDAARPGAGDAADLRAASDAWGIITPLVEVTVQRDTGLGADQLLPGTLSLGVLRDDASIARASRSALAAAISSALVEALVGAGAVFFPPIAERIEEGSPAAGSPQRGGDSHGETGASSAVVSSEVDAAAREVDATDDVPPSCFLSYTALARRLTVALLSLMRAMLELNDVLQRGGATHALLVNDLKVCWVASQGCGRRVVFVHSLLALWQCLIDVMLREVADLPLSDSLRVSWLLTLRSVLLKSQVGLYYWQSQLFSPCILNSHPLHGFAVV